MAILPRIPLFVLSVLACPLIAFSAGANPTDPLETPSSPANAPRPSPSPRPVADFPGEDSGAASRLARAQATLRSEPTFQMLKDAALRLADADILRTSKLESAARTQAALPVLKVTADMDFERDESLDQEAFIPDQWGADTDQDYGFQISAQWQLSELIFNPDLLRVYSTLSSRASEREELISLLAGYYFERRRLILTAAALPEPDLRKSIEVKNRIEELTAVIDALTGGLLSRNLSVEAPSEKTDAQRR